MRICVITSYSIHYTKLYDVHGEDRVGVLEADDFALFGEAEAAGKGRLGDDGPVGRAAAPADGATAAVE